jgi:hypothetical protein
VLNLFFNGASASAGAPEEANTPIPDDSAAAAIAGEAQAPFAEEVVGAEEHPDGSGEAITVADEPPRRTVKEADPGE